MSCVNTLVKTLRRPKDDIDIIFPAGFPNLISKGSRIVTGKPTGILPQINIGSLGARTFDGFQSNNLLFDMPVGTIPFPFAFSVVENPAVIAYVVDAWTTTIPAITTPFGTWAMYSVSGNAGTGVITFWENDKIIGIQNKSLVQSFGYVTWVKVATGVTFTDRRRFIDRISTSQFRIGMGTNDAVTFNGDIGITIRMQINKPYTNADIKRIYHETSPLLGPLRPLVTRYEKCSLKFDVAVGSQGLTSDGTCFYWGQDNGGSVDGTIYKLDYTGATINTFAGPPHSAGGDWRENNDTIMFSSGGSDIPVIWEINKNTGAKVRSWDFTGVDYNQGALVAWESGNSAYLFTSDYLFNFKIRSVTLNDDGSFVLGDLWTCETLGTSQGLDHKNGKLYYLTDQATTVKRISRLVLPPGGGAVTIDDSRFFDINDEAEGVTWDGNTLYFGTISSKIYQTILYEDF